MSESLFPPPAVPVEARSELMLARCAATMMRQRCMLAIGCGDRAAWDPEAVSELVRIANAAEHLHEALSQLTQ